MSTEVEFKMDELVHTVEKRGYDHAKIGHFTSVAKLVKSRNVGVHLNGDIRSLIALMNEDSNVASSEANYSQLCELMLMSQSFYKR